MTKQVDFDKYSKFVDAVTSDESKDFLALSDRLVQLDEKGANIERLLTAGVGLNAEAGEFLEIVKGQMQSSPNEQNWTLEWAFCIDLDPSRGGDWVNAGFTVDASGDKPKRFINEWYFVKNGKIHRFNQSRRLLVD